MDAHRPTSENGRRSGLGASALAVAFAASICRTAPAQEREAATDAGPFAASYLALAESWADGVAAQRATQAAPAPPARPAPAPRRGWQFEVAGFSDAVELDSVSVYVNDWYDDNAHKLFDWDDVDRTRYGGRILAGFDSIRFGLEVFTERFDGQNLFSGTGGDMMVLATPVVARGRDWSWIIDSSMHLGYVRDHGVVQMTTNSGSVIDDHATLEYEYAQIDLGTGLRFLGIEVAAGMRLDDMLGSLDLDHGNWYYVDATNLAFYARVGYQPPGFPLFANATWFLGDVRGAAFVLGVRF